MVLSQGHGLVFRLGYGWLDDEEEKLAMKINDLHRIGAVQQYRRQAETHPAQVGNKQKSKDEVQISAEAKELLGAGQQNTERIEQLKQSVQEGTYHVDARKIAEKLLPYLRS